MKALSAKSLVVILAFLSARFACATPQVGTPLLIDGATHKVYGFRLRRDMEETFLKNLFMLPIESTGNYKGYLDRLEVREKRLFLISLDIERPGHPFWPFNGPSVKTMFGSTVPKDGIFAEWFTGDLEEPLGEPVYFYTTITKKVRAFVFEKGILKKIEVRDSIWERLGKLREVEATKKESEEKTLEKGEH
jgi:hypothetical protein